MLLCDLPDDVLALVLERAVTSTDSARAFKDNLQLAATNSRLRRAALPLVYAELFVAHFGGHFEHGGATQPVQWTNAFLAASVGCAGLARRVSISVERPLDSVGELWSAAVVLRKVLAVWPQVRTLSISGDWNNHLYGISTEEPVPANPAQNTHSALVQIMPNVRKLVVGGNADFDPARRFFQALVEGYQGQLQSVRFLFPEDKRFGMPFSRPQLIHLVRQPGNDWILPCVDPSRLVALQLSHVHPEHAWAPFGTDNSSMPIELPVLEHLRVDYAQFSLEGQPYGTGGGRLPALHFPRLRTIQIDCSRSRCVFLECAVLPPLVKRFDLAVLAF
ncbi:hypothetical protein H4R19_000719 [Coemansia spiralis]|nr:hypothetical protein H4R19_000719 [Coemansia spiralis]